MSFVKPSRIGIGVALGAFTLAASLAGSGCGGTRQALEKQIRDLESQLVTLKSEKVNLAARNAALDDRVLLLETRQDGCREEDRRKRQLEVVRLTAENTAVDEEVEDRPLATPARDVPEGRGGRPVLRLTGSGEPLGSQAVPRVRTGALSSLSRPVAGDNLGVVPLDGDPEEAATESGPMALFQDGYRAYANGDHVAALDLLARFVKENPGHAFADDALFWRGECYLAQGKPLKGIGELERLLGRYPRSDKSASALYRIGFAYDQLGDPGKAGEYYFKVVERYPGTEAARKASRRVATIREAGASGGVMPTSAMR